MKWFTRSQSIKQFCYNFLHPCYNSMYKLIIPWYFDDDDDDDDDGDGPTANASNWLILIIKSRLKYIWNFA